MKKIFLIFCLININILAVTKIEYEKDKIELLKKIQEITDENKKNEIEIDLLRKNILKNEIKEKFQRTKIEKSLQNLEEQVKYDIKQEFKDEGLGVVYNIDQIYKNANEYYESAFNHLKWIVGFLGSLIVLAQYLFRKSEKKELDDIRAQITNRIDNFENNIIEKAQEKSQSFFMKEEEKLKKEIKEIKNSQELELKKLKEYNLNQEFQLEYIKVVSFNQRIDTRIRQLENLLSEEKYKEINKENILYQLKEEYDSGPYLYEEYKDGYLKIYENILILEKSKKNNDEKIKNILDGYIKAIWYQDRIYLLKQVLKEERQYLSTDQIQVLSLIVAVNDRTKDEVKKILRTNIDVESIGFKDADINYIISTLDTKIDSEIIKKLEDMKIGDENG